jgi:hypothetical protein
MGRGMLFCGIFFETLTDICIIRVQEHFSGKQVLKLLFFTLSIGLVYLQLTKKTKFSMGWVLLMICSIDLGRS